MNIYIYNIIKLYVINLYIFPSPPPAAAQGAQGAGGRRLPAGRPAGGRGSPHVPFRGRAGPDRPAPPPSLAVPPSAAAAAASGGKDHRPATAARGAGRAGPGRAGPGRRMSLDIGPGRLPARDSTRCWWSRQSGPGRAGPGRAGPGRAGRASRSDRRQAGRVAGVRISLRRSESGRGRPGPLLD